MSLLQASAILTVLSTTLLLIGARKMYLRRYLADEYRKMHGKYFTPLARLGGTPDAPAMNALKHAVMYRMGEWMNRNRPSLAALWLATLVFPLAFLSVLQELFPAAKDWMFTLMTGFAFLQFFLMPVMGLILFLSGLSQLARKSAEEHPIARAERLAAEDALAGNGKLVAKNMFPEVAFTL